MLYIAIAMILVGVLCFVYVSMAPSSSPKTRSSAMPPVGRETDYSETLAQARTRTYDPALEEKIYQDRKVTQPRWEEPEPTSFTKPVETPEPRPEIVESVSILGSEGEEWKPEPEEKFVVSGLLFTDSKGKIPFDQKDLSQLDLSEEIFQELRRVGEGSLFEDSGKLVFRVKNISYTYEPRDLKQIVFFDEAAVFLPSRPDLPAPIFFTESLDELKAFFAQSQVA